MGRGDNGGSWGRKGLGRGRLKGEGRWLRRGGGAVRERERDRGETDRETHRETHRETKIERQRQSQ